MLSPGLQAVLFGTNFYPGTVAALDFLAQKYRAPGMGGPTSSFPALPGVSIVRALAGYAATSSGSLALFPANVARITDLGLLLEESRTNVALWCRDLTNAAWTKTSITAALDQVGADGAANSASSLTATGANGTALQAITLASSARFQSAWVKRITGSGVIQMTMDNGVTWTAITVTSAYTQLTIPTQTLANPTVGFRIVTSGDAIAVDFVQNENGAFVTSPIPTTSAAATRPAEAISITGLAPLPAGTLVTKWTAAPVGTGGSFVAPSDLSDGSLNNFIDTAESAAAFDGVIDAGGVQQYRVSAGAALTLGTPVAAGISWSSAGAAYANSASQTQTSGAITVPNFNQLWLGRRGGSTVMLNNFIQRVLVYPRAFSTAEIQAAIQ